MIFTETKLKGAYVIELEKIGDDRGFFSRVWCQKEFEAQGLVARIAQANTSFNKIKGTLRGLHYQRPPYEEVKIMRCVRGAIYDVIVDLRPSSPTYMQWVGVELTQDNYKMLYVPENFAHGYQTLTDDAEVFYPTSQFYTPQAEAGVRWNDPAFAIEWPQPDPPVISEKDKSWPDYVPQS
jgi:dTDP-4-dehydrorhamnose 3,5-epimerase